VKLKVVNKGVSVGAKFGRKNFGCILSFMCIWKTFVTD